MPLVWIYTLPEDSWQYTGNVPVLNRFLFPVPSEMLDNLRQFKLGCGYNVWMQIIRTSVLGEWDMADVGRSVKVLAVLLMLVGALLALAICLVVTLLLIVFFKTHVGLCIRATGDNQDMVRASSINVDATLILGLCISNGLIGLAGALVTHYVGYSDTSTSNGTLIYGLAAVIIGEALFGKRGVTVGLISAVCGSVIYKLIVTFVVDIELFGTNSANLMKLMCAVIVAATFIIPAAKRTARNRKVKKEARRNA